MGKHTVRVMCENCEGSGYQTWFDYTAPCKFCDGDGYEEIETEPVELEDLEPLVPA